MISPARGKDSKVMRTGCVYGEWTVAEGCWFCLGLTEMVLRCSQKKGTKLKEEWQETGSRKELVTYSRPRITGYFIIQST